MASSSMERIAEALRARCSLPTRRWNSSGSGGSQTAFVVVVGGDQRYGAVGAAEAADDRAENFGEFGADHDSLN